MTDDQDTTDNEPTGPEGADTAAGPGAARDQGGGRIFRVQKLYLKDVSFESPAAPGVFSAGSNMEPKVSLQLNTEHRQVGENLYEVVLIVTVTSADEERTAFLVEIRQAGLFEVAGFSDLDHAHAIGSYCPGILFPYAREVVAGLVQKGGFPQVLLQPINFDALFAQQLQKERQEAGAGGGEGSAGDAGPGDEAATVEDNR